MGFCKSGVHALLSSSPISAVFQLLPAPRWSLPSSAAVWAPLAGLPGVHGRFLQFLEMEVAEVAMAQAAYERRRLRLWPWGPLPARWPTTQLQSLEPGLQYLRRPDGGFI